jgi:hypothetical protein
VTKVEHHFPDDDDPIFTSDFVITLPTGTAPPEETPEPPRAQRVIDELELSAREDRAPRGTRSPRAQSVEQRDRRRA